MVPPRDDGARSGRAEPVCVRMHACVSFAHRIRTRQMHAKNVCAACHSLRRRQLLLPVLLVFYHGARVHVCVRTHVCLCVKPEVVVMVVVMVIVRVMVCGGLAISSRTRRRISR